MLEIILLIIIFIMGIYFGSFFTLATYRIPKEENIINKHSYCPSCNHKLGILDLVPIFSYLFLGGKCRYCKQKIGIRYFLFEFLTGVVFVLFAISLKINVYNMNINTVIYFFIATFYLTFLFIIAGIEKEKNTIQQSVLIYGGIVSILYIIYSYTLGASNVYEYVIYLSCMIVLMLLDIVLFKKNLKYNYWIQILILILYMLIFSGINVTICTIILAIMSIGFRNIFLYFKNNNSKIVKEHKKTPIGFFLCISNILAIIMFNFIINYIIL